MRGGAHHPLDVAAQLSGQLGRSALLEGEDLQPTFSFRLRGAYQRMAMLDAAQRARGVVAASAGNHAHGVALAAARPGIAATLVMPRSAPTVKIGAVRRLGGQRIEVRLAGGSYSEARAEAEALAAHTGACLVHPFDHEQVVVRQAAVGLELLEQQGSPLDAVFVPVVGGGLPAGSNFDSLRFVASRWRRGELGMGAKALVPGSRGSASVHAQKPQLGPSQEGHDVLALGAT